MGKKREHMTVEEIKAQVEAEIPYVVGKGTTCIQNRAKRMKELMRRHGHDLTNAPGMTWGGPLASNGVSGSLSTKRNGQTPVENPGEESFGIGHRVVRGQRVA